MYSENYKKKINKYLKLAIYLLIRKILVFYSVNEQWILLMLNHWFLNNVLKFIEKKVWRIFNCKMSEWSKNNNYNSILFFLSSYRWVDQEIRQVFMTIIIFLHFWLFEFKEWNV